MLKEILGWIILVLCVVSMVANILDEKDRGWERLLRFIVGSLIFAFTCLSMFGE